MSGERPTTESDRIEQMLAAIRNDLPLHTTGLRNFFPKELTEKLTHARLVFLQFRHRVPERSIALTGVLNLLDQMEQVHGGPFEQLIEGDAEVQAKLKAMIGEFNERPQDSFSFALDNDLHHRLRMAAEFAGVHIRQIVATGMANFLAQLESLYGGAFDEPPRDNKCACLINNHTINAGQSIPPVGSTELPPISTAQPQGAVDHKARSAGGVPTTKDKPLNVDGAQCPICHDVIVSRWDHDLHGCGCGAIAINGGQSRWRTLWEHPNRPIHVTVEANSLEELRASSGVWPAESIEPRKYRLIDGKLLVDVA